MVGFEGGTNCIVCGRKAECFKQLDKNELDLFSMNKTTIHYKKGETIIKQGTEFLHVISFNEGLASIYIEINQTKNVMIGLLKPSEILGGPGMFSNNRYSFSVTALTDCTICLISVDIFKKIIRLNEKFAEIFLASFSSRYIEAIGRLVSLSHKQMNGRVAEVILYLSESIFQSNDFDIIMSRQDLADLAGISKESVSRIFKDFQDDRIINVSGKRIQILDMEKLNEIKLKG